MSLPLPKVVADVGPGGRIFNDYNAVTQANLKNRMAELQNDFYAPEANANIASKTTYAQFLKPQILGQFLSNPIVWSTLPKEQLQQLTNQYANALINPPKIPNYSPSPRGDNLLSVLLDKISSNKKPSPVANNDLMEVPGMAGEAPLASPEMVNQISNLRPGESYTVPSQPTNALSPGYNTPASQIASQAQIPNTYGGINPITASKAQAQALETSATSEARAATEQWKNAQDQVAKTSEAARNLANAAKGFHTAYEKAFYKGARLGSLPSEGLLAPPTLPGHNLSDEQQADRYAVQMQNQAAKENQQGHITNMDYQLFGRLKLARPLDNEAEKNIYDSTLATTERLQEKQHFFNAIRRKNPDITTPEAEGLWNNYNEQLPPYDFNTLRPIDKNKKQWKLFTTPEAVNEMRDQGTFSVTKQQNNNGKRPTTYTKNSVVLNGVKYIQDNEGNWHQ